MTPQISSAYLAMLMHSKVKMLILPVSNYVCVMAMLDIKLIRENPEMVKNNLAKRGNPECLRMLEDLIGTDKEWRAKPYKTK